jgi:hypothetical protein
MTGGKFGALVREGRTSAALQTDMWICEMFETLTVKFTVEQLYNLLDE